MLHQFLLSSMLECALFSYSPECINNVNSYAAIPESRYIDLFKLSSVDQLRELAAILGCDPNETFIVVRDIPLTDASIVRAGVEFEHRLRTFTFDQLNVADAHWAEGLSRNGPTVNSMDTIGMPGSLASDFIKTSSVTDGVYAWIEPIA